MIIKMGERQWEAPEPYVCMNLYVAGIVALPIYIKFMGVLGNILSIPTTVTTYLYYGVLWLLLLRGIWEIKKQALNAVLIAASYLIVIIFELLLHLESRMFIFGGSLFGFVTFQPSALLQSMLFTFFGLAVSNFDHLGKLLHQTSRIGILGAVITYAIMLVSGMNIHYDDMSSAYSICLVLCLLVAFKQKGDWIYILLGSVCLILAGTRGPIVCLLAVILFRFLIFEKNLLRKLAAIFLCVISGIVMLSGIGLRILLILNGFFASFGVSNLRIMDYIMDGSILDGSSREYFAEILLTAIIRKPIVGYGVGGDTVLLNGFYAHNIVLEVLVAFGVIIGSAFLVWIAFLSLRALVSGNDNIRKIGIGLFCGIVVKLFLSSTFIISREFFLFLGLCVAAGKWSGQMKERKA